MSISGGFLRWIENILGISPLMELYELTRSSALTASRLCSASCFKVARRSAWRSCSIWSRTSSTERIKAAFRAAKRISGALKSGHSRHNNWIGREGVPGIISKHQEMHLPSLFLLLFMYLKDIQFICYTNNIKKMCFHFDLELLCSCKKKLRYSIAIKVTSFWLQ